MLLNPTDGRDFTVHQWKITTDSYAILRAETPYDYVFDILIVLVGNNMALDNITSLAHEHFKVRFFLSHDLVVDSEDLVLDVTMTDLQLWKLKVNMRLLCYIL